MVSILLMILKILGIILLVVLGIILTLVILVLFVPIRYRITAHRKVAEEIPAAVKVKVTWLLHIINAVFCYPEAAYVRVRVLCFTIFRSDKPGKKPKSKKKDIQKEEIQIVNSKFQEEEEQSAGKIQEELKQEEPKNTGDDKQNKDHHRQEEEEEASLIKFLKKLWSVIKNIKYTIIQIYDKINHIIKNIRYYIKIIKSDTFKRALSVCSVQALSLLKSILPKKLKGKLLIGTGDPAGTGQVLAVYGMLYPLLGNHIDITPDFDRQIVEGDLFIKGKITVFKLIKAAWIVYFNRDLRRLLKLFKREAA